MLIKVQENKFVEYYRKKSYTFEGKLCADKNYVKYYKIAKKKISK